MSAKNLEIQKFLETFKTPEEANEALVSNYNIDVKEQYLKFNNNTKERVWLYNYNIINSRGDNSLENEARCLILNDKFDIVSMSFKRFFNVNEPYAAPINWNKAWAEYKNDGSLINIYRYNNTFFIQTRRTCDASARLMAGVTYREAVIETLKKILGSCYAEPFRKEGDNYCWSFEYVSPYNRIVTPYEKDDLILLSIFDKNKACEIEPDIVDDLAFKYGFTRPDIYEIGGVKDCISLCEAMDPMEEGIVVVDNFQRRIKIKNIRYLKIGYVVGGFKAPRKFAEAVLSGDTKEILSYRPEFKKIFSVFESVLNDIIKEVLSIWRINKDISSRKNFANIVKRYKFSGILFALYDGRIDCIGDIIDRIKPKLLVDETELRREREFNEFFYRR